MMKKHFISEQGVYTKFTHSYIIKRIGNRAYLFTGVYNETEDSFFYDESKKIELRRTQVEGVERFCFDWGDDTLVID